MLGEQYKSFSSSLCNLLHSPVTSSLLGPNILLNTMFSNILSFLSSRNVNDQVSRPYKTTDKIIYVDYEYTIKLDNILGSYIHQLLLIFFLCVAREPAVNKVCDTCRKKYGRLALEDGLDKGRVVIRASLHNCLYRYVCRIICQNFLYSDI